MAILRTRAPLRTPTPAALHCAAPRHNPDTIKPNQKVVYGELDSDSVRGLFTKYKGDFNRNYATEEEEDNRFEIFKLNLKHIDSLNYMNPLALFTITDAADMTDDEKNLRKMSNKWSSYEGMKASLPAPITELAAKGPDAAMGTKFEDADLEGSEWLQKGQVGWVTEDDCAACTMFPDLVKYSLTNMPTDFDWRENGAVSSVKNQKYCGSCWTFSTAADVEGTHFLATGNMTSMSEQQLIACDNMNDGCEGGWPYAAMQYLETTAMVSAKDYPYKGIYMDYEQSVPTCDTDLLHEKMTKNSYDVAHVGGFQFVAMGADYEPLMALAMVKNGPLSIAFNANGMEYYAHGIIGCETIAGEDYCEAGSIDDHSPCDPESLDHAVLAVGIGVQEGVQEDTDSSADSTQYWVIKNSWGEEWGEDGYYRLERGVNKCGVANMVVHSVVKDA
mmetsp:Transcript_75597/g.215086  ORF Transcript_75597/g.215086 Transcript_75597/m.215086 type:complete len:445 (+) Transcript_75597:219-1553(+)